MNTVVITVAVIAVIALIGFLVYKKRHEKFDDDLFDCNFCRELAQPCINMSARLAGISPQHKKQAEQDCLNLINPKCQNCSQEPFAAPACPASCPECGNCMRHCCGFDNPNCEDRNGVVGLAQRCSSDCTKPMICQRK